MPFKKIEQFENNKIAFVCSGGAVKAAAWHLGVSLALEELGFHFYSNNDEKDIKDIPNCISTYVGSSAGSLISLYLSNGLKAKDVINAHLKHDNAPIAPVSYKDMLSLKRPMRRKKHDFDDMGPRNSLFSKFLSPLKNFSGLFTTHGLHSYLTDNVLTSDDFKDYKPDVFIVATQLDHSKKVIFGRYNYPSPMHDDTAHYFTDVPVAEAASASMSIPFFYSPYPIINPYTENIEYYIDGEIRDTLSSHVAIDNKCDFIICSWTHTPYHFTEEIGSLYHYGIPAICLQSIYLLIQRKIISQRSRLATYNDLFDSVHEYMKDQKFSDTDRKNILNLIEKKLHLKRDIKFIDIYPDHKEANMFFAPNFSLNKEITSKAVKAGYKKTIEAFGKL